MSKSKKDNSTQKLLIEIGTEEIPANYLAYANQDNQALFRGAFLAALKEVDEIGSVSVEKFDVFLTPRRIILDLSKIAFSNASVEEIVYGPPKDKAYDDNGSPQPMLQGFMKSKGIKLSDLKHFEHKGRECVGYKNLIKPTPLNKLIEPILASFVKHLNFPKWMWWDESNFLFPRPVRSLLVLLNDKPVKIRLGDTVSGKKIRVFSNGTRKEVTILNHKNYYEKLKSNKVIFNQEDRFKKIETKIKQITLKYKGVYEKQEELLEEVVYLTENPVCISGKFNADFANLPSSVLTSSLSKSQRLFSVKDKKGKHLPYFIAVLDGEVKSSSLVTSTIASILRAKLQDSQFFYKEDMKVFNNASDKDTGLFKLQKDLEKLLYIKGMGSVANKSDRLSRVIDSQVSDLWNLNTEEKKSLQEAIYLSKTDLLTQMVGEFPELQGSIGKIYLKNSGKSSLVFDAVGEHYLPISPEGKLPKSKLGALLSILDKADLIISCFVLGKIPTSSQDPYALKRAFSGILRIANKHQIDIQWTQLVSNVLDIIQNQGINKDFDRSQVERKLLQFYLERSLYYFEGQRFDKSYIEAVLAVDPDRLLSVYQRLQVLHTMKNKSSFKKALKIIQRISNILKSAKNGEIITVQKSLFSEDLEYKLYEQYESQKSKILEAKSNRDFSSATSLYAETFFDILHAFFEQVLVNSEDVEVRKNRLSLLASLKDLYVTDFADLSKIRVELN